MNTRSIKNRTALLFFFFFLIASINLFGNDGTYKVVISEIQTEINGKTKEKFLLGEIGIHKGMEFKTTEDLETFLADAKQDLINMRVFEEVDFNATELSISGDTVQYKVFIKVKDTFTFYPIPYPKYNSNTGGRLGLKIYYYNAFGTLTDWLLFTNMDINKDYFGNWDIPNWHITPAVEGINIWGQDFRAEYSHKFRTVSTPLKIDSYHNDSISIGTKIYLPLDFYYTMDPRLGVSYGLDGYTIDPNTEIATAYPGSLTIQDNPDIDILEFSWNHAIGYDTIDWIGNFRDGFAASISNSLILSSDLNPDMPVNFSSTISGDIKYFWRISRHFNFSTWALASVSFNREMQGLGENLRGVRDDLLFGDKALFWSVDMNISVIDWDGVGEAQLRPFFNIGYARNDINDQLAGDERNMLAYGTGADFVLYLDKLNALQARATLGIDLSNYDWSDGEKYEIDITTSLSY